MRIIKRIKKDRNRACLQNILSLTNREENKMERAELKEIMDKLVANNVIVNNGVNEKYSYRIVEDKLIATSTQTLTESEDEVENI